MNFAGMNYLAILVAAIVAFVIGAIYYGSLSKPWMKAARLDPDGPKPAMAPLMITTDRCRIHRLSSGSGERSGSRNSRRAGWPTLNMTTGPGSPSRCMRSRAKSTGTPLPT